MLGLDEGVVGYEQLLPDTTVLDIQGLSVRVLTLERLIAEKERAGREKDKAVLPLLRASRFTPFCVEVCTPLCVPSALGLLACALQTRAERTRL